MGTLARNGLIHANVPFLLLSGDIEMGHWREKD